MHVLRLGNSSDFDARVPEALRAPAIAEEVLASAAGEPVETLGRVIWPSPTLAARADGA